MKKLCVVAIALFIFFVTIIFHFNNIKDNTDLNISEEVDEIEMLVNKKLNEMTIDEKIAQMIMIQYRDNKSYDKLYEMFATYKFGGFILFNENMDTYSNTRDLVSKLKGYNDIPLMVGIDQEGGRVQRLKNLKETSVTDIPYMYDLGKTHDTNLAYQVGKVMGEELRTIGVNVVFAPVIDIYSNKENTVIGKRSFGEDATLVSVMADALARGLEDTGVVPTYKHFPGHGDTSTDSHSDLPVIYKDYYALKEMELKPFMSAINNNAKMIMVGHIALPNITGDKTPASLSKTLITDVLKNNMGYDGLVITDALNMGALTKYYSDEEIVLNAINGGVHILLMPNDIDLAIKCIRENVSEEKINDIVKKILTFKYKYLSSYELLGSENLGSIEHKDVVSKIN